MSVSSISFTFVNVYGTQAGSTRSATAPTESAPICTAPCDSDDDSRRTEHTPGRHNPLVEAMMTALQALGLTGSTPAATTPTAAAPASTPITATPTATASTAATVVPTTTTPVTTATAPAAPAASTAATTTAASADAATTTATTTPSTAATSQAVAQFAHALWGALHTTAASGWGDSGVTISHGPRHRHGHGSHRGYDGLADRLEALASAGDVAAIAATTAVAAPPKAAAETSTASTSVAATTATVAASTASTTEPLADAFGKLMTALRGSAAPAGTQENATLLSQFLHTLAKALRPSSVDASAIGTGALVNVSA